MEIMTTLNTFFGGALIGLSAITLFLFTGRIAGISGIMAGFKQCLLNKTAWRPAFLLGLVAGAFLYTLANPAFIYSQDDNTPLGLLISGGFLVGLGSRLGNGCTSGHGICGIANFSPRSIIATLTFMSCGLLTVFLIKHLFPEL